ncbi:MBL fold metallo-hydrolase [Citreimonas salinaria]|uniref:Glyoxylase, beta-lactamase superfamily II n=1 Tax=Citreimonas salinaria TaxID=321339 RepID=A0A1H3IET1_9RHOB|nr:MBL fold metallo-hydrolase [Citreimonas salinaria]SDY26082.1 Glyoxylase, beta-lactamase superfamily II [Citreimonas salinaria]
MTDPQPDFDPRPGVAEPVGPGLRRVLAPNPSPMTYRGTNTYLVGKRGLAVIDPGPDDGAHLQAILDAVQPGQMITHILVTHAHLDHSPLARPLSARTGAPILAFGPPDAGRSATMRRLAAQGNLSGGEGVDTGFAPDQTLQDGAFLDGDGWRIEALHLPGHMANHMGFAIGDTLFTGDLVMGWASSLISPPDGDLAAFMASLDRLLSRDWMRFLPGHGAPVDDPAERTRALRAHRRARESAIIAALASGPASASALARSIYTDTPAALLPAASRNVLAHLLALYDTGAARCEGPIRADAVFGLG